MKNQSKYKANITKIEKFIYSSLSEINSDKTTVSIQFYKQYLLQVLATSYSSLPIGFYEEQTSCYLIQDESKFSFKTVADNLKLLIDDLPYHPALTIAILAQEEEHISDKKSQGAFYTDLRLAKFLVQIKPSINGYVLDPACGTGILLISYILEHSKNQQEIDNLLKYFICGADLSKNAISGAFIAMSTLTKDKDVAQSLGKRLRVGDSLLAGDRMWLDLGKKFDIIIANPPWEKLKASKYEVLLQSDMSTVYGANSDRNIEHKLSEIKQKLKQYINSLDSHYFYKGKGEKDLYIYFLELAINLLSSNGEISYLIPAGLIRAQGTEIIRKVLLTTFSDVEITLFSNHPKYFDIDSRFKFISMKLKKDITNSEHKIKLHFGSHEDFKLIRNVGVTWNIKELKSIRVDLTIPEVKDEISKDIFQRLSINGKYINRKNSMWQMSFMREVDMTLNKNNFKKEPDSGYIPVIEGRMLWHYNSKSKIYISGSGRAAKWESSFFDLDSSIKTQFYYPIKALDAKVKERINKFRIGFCDIVGQTNERSMMAAIVPEMTVCGNKVPTVLFKDDFEDNRIAYCWLAISNSMTFDWLLRRVITTNVNFFLLKSIPLPNLDFNSESAYQMARIAKRLSDGDYENLWQRGKLLGTIEQLVINSYGIELNELDVIFEDFPLLDRNQPTLPNEISSTITKDFLRTILVSNENHLRQDLILRVEAARELNAIPFIPSSLKYNHEYGLQG